jgi:hypothetical protein
MLLKNNRHIFLWLALAAGGLVVLVNFYIWSWLPVYSDEISNRIIVARAFFENWQRITPFPACETSNHVPIPWIFYPAAFLSSGYSLIQDMRLWRVLGEAFFAVTFLLALGRFIPFVRQDKTGWTTMLALCLAMPFFVGVLPSITMMVRAEHIILLTIAFCCWAAARHEDKKYAPAWLILVFLLYSTAIYAHPKIIFFLPAILLITAGFARVRPVMAVVTLGLLLATTGYGIAINGWQLLHCPESPAFEARIRDSSLNPLDAVKSPGTFIHDFARHMLTRDYSKVTGALTLNAEYEFDYLPKINKAYTSRGIANVFILA